MLLNLQGAYVSLILRKGEVEELLDDSAGCALLEQSYESVATLALLARRLGFSQHPLWKKVVADKQRKACGRKDVMSIAAESIMYSLDSEAQFANLSGAAKKREKWTKAKREKAKRWLQGGSAKVAFSDHLLERYAMEKHMHALMRTGTLYSIPRQAAPFVSMQQALQPGPRAQFSEDAQDMSAALELDIADYDLGGNLVVAGASPDPVFFRIVTTRLGGKKHVPLPAASAQHLSKSDFCVTVHKAYKRGDESWSVEAEPGSATWGGKSCLYNLHRQQRKYSASGPADEMVDMPGCSIHFARCGARDIIVGR